MPFDLDRLEGLGAPVPVVEDIAGVAGQGGGQLDFSQTGTLVYLSGKGTDAIWNLSWVDQTGKGEVIWSAPSAILTPKVSPDGKRIAGTIGTDLYVYDLARAAATRLTFNPVFVTRRSLWTPDGKHLVYVARDGADLAVSWIRADGSNQPQKVYAVRNAPTALLDPRSFSPDGRRLAITQTKPGSAVGEIVILPLSGTDPDRPTAGPPEPFLSEPGGQGEPAFSPDGRWIAYTSWESAGTASQVFVRPYRAGAAGGRWQISTLGGRFPLWAPNGRELYYHGPDGRMMAVTFQAKGESFTADKPRQWGPTIFSRTGAFSSFDIARDGSRFLGFPSTNVAPDDKSGVKVAVLLNFFDELKRRVPVGGK
jgi:serine/threonine-protein kinase